MVTPSASNAATKCSSLMEYRQEVWLLYPASRHSCTPDFVRFSGCWSSSRNRLWASDHRDSPGAENSVILALRMFVFLFFGILVVGTLTIFIGQMRVRLHRCNHASMSKSFLHKLPIDGFTILQVRANKGCGVCVPQNVWMQDYSRFLGVVLEDLLHRSHIQCSTVG